MGGIQDKMYKVSIQQIHNSDHNHMGDNEMRDPQYSIIYNGLLSTGHGCSKGASQRTVPRLGRFKFKVRQMVASETAGNPDEEMHSFLHDFSGRIWINEKCLSMMSTWPLFETLVVLFKNDRVVYNLTWWYH